MVIKDCQNIVGARIITSLRGLLQSQPHESRDLDHQGDYHPVPEAFTANLARSASMTIQMEVIQLTSVTNEIVTPSNLESRTKSTSECRVWPPNSRIHDSNYCTLPINTCSMQLVHSCAAVNTVFFSFCITAERLSGHWFREINVFRGPDTSNTPKKTQGVRIMLISQDTDAREDFTRKCLDDFDVGGRSELGE